MTESGVCNLGTHTNVKYIHVLYIHESWHKVVRMTNDIAFGHTGIQIYMNLQTGEQGSE